jgi:hypothetical protein
MSVICYAISLPSSILVYHIYTLVAPINFTPVQALAYEWSWPWNNVAGRLRPVQLELDAWICGFVGSGEAHVAWAESACTSS